MFIAIIIYQFVLLIFVYFCEAVKENVTIAGVFNIYDVYGNIDYEQLEHLSSFVLAVNDINSRNDFLSDVHLNYIIQYGHGVSNSLTAALTISNHRDDIKGVVSALPYQEISIMSSVFAEKNILLASSVVDDAEFLDGDKYPYLVHTNPLSSFSGYLQQVVLCQLGTQGIVIFSSTDLTHVNKAYESTNGDICNLKVRANYMFHPDTTDFSIIINNALNIHSTVVLIYTNAKCAALLMEQGYKAGLFRQGVMIILGEDILNVDMIPHFSKSTDVGSILKGSVGQIFWPKYYLLSQSSEGVAFMNKWINQNSSDITCNTTVDSDGNYYLYHKSSKSGLCVGLNFSSYKSDGSNLNDFTAYTYDATYLLAYGLVNLRKNNISLTGENLRFAVLNNVSFTGPTGPVNLLKGNPLVKNYSRGNRGGALAYRVLNFKDDVYYTNNSQGFCDTLTILSTGRFVPCNKKLLSCYNIFFNTLDGTFASGYPPYAFSKLPKYIKIGALFAPLDSNGYPNKMQIEMLAAFKLAVDEINNKNDGIFDDMLPSTTILFDLEITNGYLGAINSAQRLIDAFYYSGVKGVISGLPNEETKATHSVFSTDGEKIFQLNSFASDSALVDGSTYMYKAQLVPVDSYEGAALQDLICRYFGYRKVAFVSSNDVAGQNLLHEITRNREICVFDQLLNYIMPISQSDYSNVVKELKVSGAKVIILFVSSSTAASILALGYQHGIFGEGYQVFTSSNAASRIISSFSRSADVLTLMRGLIFVEFGPDASFTTEEGIDFLHRWKHQQYRGSRIKHGFSECDNSLDDSGNTYLYQNENGTICTGLNFTSYDIMGSNLSPYTLFTYDAVHALASGLDKLIRAGIDINGETLRTVLISQVNFTGASGYVEFKKSDVSELYFSRGDREVGVHYKIMNFNPDAYQMNSSNSFVQVFEWNLVESVHKCDNYNGCKDITYNSINNSPVSETKPTIIKTMSLSGIIVLSFVFAVVILLVGLYTIFTFYYFRNKLIKAAQPEMLICILFGVFLAAGRVLMASLPITDTSCISGLWIAHMSFLFAFGALFIKTYRVHVVINSKTFKRVIFTGRKAAGYMFIGFVGFVIILIILTVTGRPHRSYNISIISNQTIKTVRCSFKRSYIHTAVFILEAIIIFIGARLCLAVKNVPDAINESKYIALSISFILLLAILVFPIVFLLGLDPVVYQLIASLSFGLAAIVTVNIIFLPKAISILNESGYSISLKDNKRNKVVVPTDKDINGPPAASLSRSGSILTTNNGTISLNTVNHENLFEVSKIVLMKLKADDRTRFCYENINKWQAMLLNHSAMSSGSSNVSSVIENVNEPISNTL